MPREASIDRTVLALEPWHSHLGPARFTTVMSKTQLSVRTLQRKLPRGARFALAVAALSASLATGFVSCAGKGVQPVSEESGIPLAGTFTVNRYSIENGLKLLVIEDHSSPTFAYQTWFRVGSRDETPEYTGLAHLFEHMMFKETKSLKEGQFDKILEAAGTEGLNAFTSRDYTAYVQELPRNKTEVSEGKDTEDNLELIARLESERMVNLIVDEKAFKTETEVVQNERRFRTENNPDGTLYQELFELAYTEHPYHWPVIGYQQDLDRMSAKEAREFYQSFYSPSHATIIVVGDVKAKEVLKVVKKHYGNIPARPLAAQTIPAEPPQASARHKLLKLNIKTEKLLMGYHIPSINSPDVPALTLVQGILGGGKSSRLHRALVETGISSSVEAYGLDDKDPALFIIGTNLQKGKKAAQAEAIIMREITRLAQRPIGEKELEKAKNLLNFDFIQGLDSNASKARFLGHYEAVAGNFEEGLKIMKAISQVNAAQVQDVTKRFFQPTNRSVITGVPK